MARSPQKQELPAAIVRAQERFESWRSSRKKRSERIPIGLWNLAMRVARRHGCWPTARALRLDSCALKRRLKEAEEGTSKGPAAEKHSPRFVEIIPTQRVGPPGDCLIEVEDSSGAKLRIELRGLDGAAIGAMARAFLEGKRA